MKINNRSLLLLMVLLSMLVLTACKTPGDLTGQQTPVIGENGYPVPVQGGAEAYPGVDTTTYGNVTELKAPAEAHTPEPGTASISGLVYVPGAKYVVKGTVIYLVPAEGENKDQVPGILIGSGLESRGDIVSRTDDQGNFYIDNIPPGNYFLVVSFQNNIVLTSISETDLAPRLYTFEADASIPLGLIVSPGD